jgi:4-carboxymuconolactone decarboxylase
MNQHDENDTHERRKDDQYKDDQHKDDQYDRGLCMREQVMGEDFVAWAFAGADEFTLPLQEFIARNAWGTTWCRDGLDLKTRSLVTVAMLAALGRSQELKGHVRGALNNGATVEELREVLLHAAVYYGVPAAMFVAAIWPRRHFFLH